MGLKNEVDAATEQELKIAWKVVCLIDLPEAQRVKVRRALQQKMLDVKQIDLFDISDRGVRK